MGKTDKHTPEWFMQLVETELRRQNVEFPKPFKRSIPMPESYEKNRIVEWVFYDRTCLHMQDTVPHMAPNEANYFVDSAIDVGANGPHLGWGVYFDLRATEAFTQQQEAYLRQLREMGRVGLSLLLEAKELKGVDISARATVQLSFEGSPSYHGGAFDKTLTVSSSDFHNVTQIGCLPTHFPEVVLREEVKVDQGMSLETAVGNLIKYAKLSQR